MKLDSAVLYTNDILRITKFYCDVIGLELVYQAGDKFVQFKFANGVGLGIKKVVEEREVPGHQTIFVATEDIEADFKKMKERGVEFRKELTKEDWGLQFSVLDPDKNKVEFIQRK